MTSSIWYSKVFFDTAAGFSGSDRAVDDGDHGFTPSSTWVNSSILTFMPMITLLLMGGISSSEYEYSPWVGVGVGGLHSWFKYHHIVIHSFAIPPCPRPGPYGPNPACSMWPHMEHGHEAG